MTRRKPPGDYEVGYGRPPVSTRFQPGQSGNRRGRPKKPKTIAATIDAALMKRIKVNGGDRTMTVLEIIIGQLVRDAAGKNGQKAVQTLFSLYHRFTASPDVDLEPTDLPSEDRALIADYLSRLGPTSANAAAATLLHAEVDMSPGATAAAARPGGTEDQHTSATAAEGTVDDRS